MKRWMRRWMRLMPHIGIVMAGMMLVFWVIDRVNRKMGFMTNDFHKLLALLLSLFVLLESIILIVIERTRSRERPRR